MDQAVADALAIDRTSGARERTVDITTVGRKSGEPRRIETWFYRVDGTVYLTGLPGKRGWAANLEADPSFTFHLKHGIQADLPAQATRITDATERRRLFTAIFDELREVSDTPRDLDAWLAASPLFAVAFD
jgi:hypothetical protein